MSRTTASSHSQSVTPEELHTAEERAERAENRVEQLERRLDQFENSRQQPSPSQARPEQDRSGTVSTAESSSADDLLHALRNEPMMDHLLNALESRQNIGHYGRLVFAMVAHHFLPENAMLQWLTKDPGTNSEEAAALLRQVEGRDYNPPRRDRILNWQSQQDFPILPNPEDPDCGNVYRNLKFPQSVYEHIQEYQEEKVHAEAADSR